MEPDHGFQVNAILVSDHEHFSDVWVFRLLGCVAEDIQDVLFNNQSSHGPTLPLLGVCLIEVTRTVH